MHPNSIFRAAPRDEALAVAATRGFATLAVNGPNGGPNGGPDGPLVAAAPFVLTADGGAAELHLMRSNPVARALPARAVMVVQGPDGYVSPDWYGLPDQVPTWNYVAVHLSGPAEALPDAALRAHLDALSAAFEARLDKAPWTSAKMTPGVMERMMRALVPVRVTIEDVAATRKLNQNKPAAARLAAADRIEGGTGHELGALAALMRAPAP